MSDNMQSTNILPAILLCRIVLLCCSEVPFTSAYCIATVLSLALIALLALPLWMQPPPLDPDGKTPLFFRLAGIYTAAILLSQSYSLLQELQSAHPMPTVLLMLFAACFCFMLPRYTTGRVAEALLFFLSIGGILLLGRAFFTGKALLLYTPASSSIQKCFCYAMQDNLPLMFLPLGLPANGNISACRKRLCVCVLSLLAMPLIILAGTMQNGRLSNWKGNPFFLLISQSQTLAAIRIDGFWSVMLIAAAITVLTFCMQLCILPRTANQICMMDALILGVIIAIAGTLFTMQKQWAWISIVLVFLGITVYPLYHILRRKKEVAHGS